MNRDLHDPAKGFLHALAGCLLLSTNFITAKYGLQGFNPETFSLVWTSGAALYAFLIVLLGRETRNELFPIRKMKAMLALGATTALGMILAWNGLKRLDPSFASFLWRFGPVLAILSGVLLLKERLSLKEILAVAMMFTGGLWGVVGRWQSVGSGVVFTLFACCAGAGQLLIAKSQIREIHPNILVAYRTGLGALLIACWVLVSGSADFSVEVRYWYVTLLGAFLGPCASFLFTFRSYKYWELSRASMVLTIQPLFVVLLAYAFLGSLPTKRELVGGCLILSGAMWLAYLQVGKIRKSGLEV